MAGSRFSGLLCLGAMALAGPMAVGDTSIEFWLANPGPSAVTAGMPFTLEIWASFDAPVVATRYRLRALGDATATLTARSQDPTGPCGLTYLSQTSQDPFESGLPFDLSAAILNEVAYDAHFDDMPGGPSDGIPANTSGVILDTITIVPEGTGDLTVMMWYTSAVTTQDNPDGEVFDNIALGNYMVDLTVAPRPCDWDDDGDVDLVDFAEFANCLSGPAEGDGFVAPSQGCLDVFDVRPTGSPDGDVDIEDFGVFQEVFTG